MRSRPCSGNTRSYLRVHSKFGQKHIKAGTRKGDITLMQIYVNYNARNVVHTVFIDIRSTSSYKKAKSNNEEGEEKCNIYSLIFGFNYSIFQFKHDKAEWLASTCVARTIILRSCDLSFLTR